MHPSRSPLRPTALWYPTTTAITTTPPHPAAAPTADLKKALDAAGIASQFHGGTLYCVGNVAVRRQGEEGAGGLLVEGPLSQEYYRIRGVVYGQYHVC